MRWFWIRHFSKNSYWISVVYTWTSDLGNLTLKFNISYIHDNIGFYSLSLRCVLLLKEFGSDNQSLVLWKHWTRNKNPDQHLYSSSTGCVTFLLKMEDNNVYPPTTWLLRVKWVIDAKEPLKPLLFLMIPSMSISDDGRNGRTYIYLLKGVI